MKRAIAIVFAGFFAATAWAADGGDTEAEAQLDPPVYDAFDINLDDFLWEKRPVVIFADTPADPRFTKQLELLQARRDALADRDVVIITDTNSDDLSDLRKKLRPRGFMLALLGKDGQVKLRKPSPWDVRELTRVIDKIPLRQQELRDRRAGDLN